MERQFKAIGITPTLVEAVNSSTFSQQQIDTLSNPKLQQLYTKRPLTPGELACSLSHQKAYNMLIKSDKETALIFEDDADISKLKAEIIAECESILLANNKPTIIILAPVKKALKDEAYVFSDNRHKLYPFFRGSAAYGYMINKEAATLLLKANTPVHFIADCWIIIKKIYHGKIDILSVKPHLIEILSGDDGKDLFSSDINTTNSNSLKINKQRLYITSILKYFFFKKSLVLENFYNRVTKKILNDQRKDH